jgi:3'(2'), 5'-bisphosphate nucleotidase
MQTPFDILNEGKIALDAVLEASKEILKVYNSDFSSELKEGKEPLTKADTRSNEILIKRLSVLNYPILSEESKDNLKRLNSDTVWIIDPLDGTTDFVQKTGEFSVMVALIKKNRPILGIVYQPTENMLYLAQDGKGAYMRESEKWSKLQVSKVSKLTESKAITSRNHFTDTEKSFINDMGVLKHIQKGSAGLKVAEISKGNAELYFTFTNEIKQWDTCAAYCIVKEAGGKMTDMLGNEIRYNTKVLNHENGLLVTNGIVHDDIVDGYKNFLKK